MVLMGEGVLTLSAGDRTAASAAGVALTTSPDGRSLTVEGGLVRVNRAMEGLTWVPPKDWYGTATVALSATDLGASGRGGVLTALPASFDVSVDSVNDPPTVAFVGLTDGAVELEMDEVSHVWWRW